MFGVVGGVKVGERSDGGGSWIVLDCGVELSEILFICCLLVFCDFLVELLVGVECGE